MSDKKKNKIGEARYRNGQNFFRVLQYNNTPRDMKR